MAIEYRREQVPDWVREGVAMGNQHTDGNESTDRQVIRWPDTTLRDVTSKQQARADTLRGWGWEEQTAAETMLLHVDRGIQQVRDTVLNLPRGQERCPSCIVVMSRDNYFITYHRKDGVATVNLSGSSGVPVR